VVVRRSVCTKPYQKFSILVVLLSLSILSFIFHVVRADAALQLQSMKYHTATTLQERRHIHDEDWNHTE
jgi:hypothetical protein